MQVIDEVSRKLVDIDYTSLVVVDHTESTVIYGYVSNMQDVIPILICNNGRIINAYASMTLMRTKLVFNKSKGIYMSKIGVPKMLYLDWVNTLGCGEFPYAFRRNYEAIDNFDLFAGKQKVIKCYSNTISKYMKYSFGLEFETSQGYIPEDICYRDGLIPLRDGSISGLEYSTVVLQGNKGINLLRQQLKTLKEYTVFNKECSLHIHFGGFPLEPEYLFRVYQTYKTLEDQFLDIVPELTFKSSEYKQNGKNYCKKLPKYDSFEDLYLHLVRRPFYGSLIQPHPDDIERKRKWNIGTRYYALNFINAICYDVNKTIEFRFLRPTYNYNKILLWLYIFNAILVYAERNEECHGFSISRLLAEIYPIELTEQLNEGLRRLKILRIMQYRNGDLCGSDVMLEDRIFHGRIKY